MVLQRAHFLDEQTKARGYGWTGYVGVGGVCVSAASSVTQQGWWGRGPVHPHPCALLARVAPSAEPPMCAVNQGPAPRSVTPLFRPTIVQKLEENLSRASQPFCNLKRRKGGREGGPWPWPSSVPF